MFTRESTAPSEAVRTQFMKTLTSYSGGVVPLLPTSFTESTAKYVPLGVSGQNPVSVQPLKIIQSPSAAEIVPIRITSRTAGGDGEQMRRSGRVVETSMNRSVDLSDLRRSGYLNLYGNSHHLDTAQMHSSSVLVPSSQHHPVSTSRGRSGSFVANPVSQTITSRSQLINGNISSRSSRISTEQTQTVRHEPRLVERKVLPAREVGTRVLEPVLVGVHTAEATKSVDSANLHHLLIECFKRIVLMGMENDRLVERIGEYEQVVVELRAKLNSLEVLIQEYEISFEDYGRIKSRTQSLETRISEILKERSVFLNEIELLHLKTKRQNELEIECNSLKDKITMLAVENERLVLGVRDIEELRVKYESARREAERARELENEIQRINGVLNQTIYQNQLLQQRQAEMDSLKDKFSMLVSENERLLQVKDEMQASFNLQIEKSMLQIQSLERENARLRDQINGENNQLNIVRADYERRIEELRMKIDDLHAEIEGLEIRAKASIVLEETTASLKKSLGVNNSEREELLKKVGELERDNHNLQSHLSAESRRVTQLSNRVDLFTTENALLQDKIDALTRELDALTRQATDRENTLVGESQNLRKSVTNLETQISEIGALRQSLLETEAKLRQKEDAFLALEADFARLKIEFDNMDKYCADVEVENGELKSEIKQLDDILHNSDRVLLELRARLEESERMTSSMVGSDDHNSQIGALKSELDNLREAIKRLESTLERKDQEIQSLLSSRADLEGRLKTSEQQNAGLRQNLQELKAKMESDQRAWAA